MFNAVPAMICMHDIILTLYNVNVTVIREKQTLLWNLKSFLVCRLNCMIAMIWQFIVFVVITMQNIWKCRILLEEKGLWNSICVSFFYDREAMRMKAKSAINGLKESLLDMKTFINEVSNIFNCLNKLRPVEYQ